MPRCVAWVGPADHGVLVVSQSATRSDAQCFVGCGTPRCQKSMAPTHLASTVPPLATDPTARGSRCPRLGTEAHLLPSASDAFCGSCDVWPGLLGMILPTRRDPSSTSTRCVGAGVGVDVSLLTSLVLSSSRPASPWIRSLGQTPASSLGAGPNVEALCRCCCSSDVSWWDVSYAHLSPDGVGFVRASPTQPPPRH